MTRAYLGTVTEGQRINVLNLVKSMMTVSSGQPNTDVCNAALLLAVTVAVRGGATEDMVVEVVRALCTQLKAKRSH